MISSSYRVPVGGSVVKCKGCRLEHPAPPPFLLSPRGHKGSDIQHTHARTGARARRKIRFMQKPTSKPDTKSAKKKNCFCKHRLEGKLFSLLVLLILDWFVSQRSPPPFWRPGNVFFLQQLWPSLSETKQERLQQQRQT